MTKLSTFQSKIDNFAFNHARVFGGNNQAEMSIRPTWNLQQGIIRDLYSGGNKGSMTSPEGLLLEIAPDTVENVKDLVVENLYGGCRMADVKPTVGGIYKPTTNLPGYSFPPELSARVLIRGGKVNNVYGGNDITGTVYGGNAIGIYTTINGDVYGGGNGGGNGGGSGVCACYALGQWLGDYDLEGAASCATLASLVNDQLGGMYTVTCNAK